MWNGREGARPWDWRSSTSEWGVEVSGEERGWVGGLVGFGFLSGVGWVAAGGWVSLV